jgi:type IV pilus assembly protein PilN
MIRINLLASERRAVKAVVSRGMEAGQKMMVLGSLILVLTLAALGWRYWALGQQAAQLEEDIAAAQREEARLQEILRQVNEFEARKVLLEARLALIDELRKGQNAPVHMIDQISRSLPEMTWLTKLTQDGYNVTLEGRCLSLAALSDFVGNLEATRYFARPVEIVETEVMSGQATAPDLISFTIKGTFRMAGIEPKPGVKPAGPGGKIG